MYAWFAFMSAHSNIICYTIFRNLLEIVHVKSRACVCASICMQLQPSRPQSYLYIHRMRTLIVTLQHVWCACELECMHTRMLLLRGGGLGRLGYSRIETAFSLCVCERIVWGLNNCDERVWFVCGLFDHKYRERPWNL